MTAASWPIFSLLRTVLASIFEVGILCVAGYVLARKGILDKKTQKQINRINVSLFTPSLLFSKVAFSLTPEKLQELWIIPMVFVVNTLTSMSVAYGFGTVMRLRKSQRCFAMAASMFMNSNSLPVALMQSLVYSVKMLRWGDSDTEDAMLGRALTYLVLYSTFGMILRWSYGVRLLAQADEEPEPAKDIEQQQQPTETTSLLHHGSAHPAYASIRAFSSPAVILHRPKQDNAGSSSSSSSSSATSSPSISREGSTEHVAPGTPTATGPGTPTVNHDDQQLHPHAYLQKSKSYIKAKYFQSFPTTPMYPHSDTSDSESSDGSSTSDDNNSSGAHTGVSRFIPFFLRLRRSRKPLYVRARTRIKRILHSINDFMTAPMWAAFASLIVACVPSLQHAMMEHLKPVKGALNSAGNCSIPLTLIVLGGYFWTPEKEEEEKKEERSVLRRIQKRIGWAQDTKGKGHAENDATANGHTEAPSKKDDDDGASILERVKQIFEEHRAHPKLKSHLPDVHIHNPLHHSHNPIHNAIHHHSHNPFHHHHDPLDTLRENLKDFQPHVPHIVRPGHADKQGRRPGETRTVIVAVLSRMVLVPLVLLPLLTLLILSDWTDVFDDPVFAVTNVLLITSAPALTLAQITQAASGDAFERLISRTIFWAYCVVTPVSTIVSVMIGLLLTRIQ